ncbi:MAG TPA: hypothetical protein VK893_14830 [Pyrinomonadaceae bacterium]|nr:hypothetical protein [Pyrinomonadaceae bacterium]
MRMWIRVVVGLAVVAALGLTGWVTGSQVGAQNSETGVQSAVTSMPSSLLAAQSTLTGAWTASVSKEGNKLKLNLEREHKRGKSNMGQDFDFTDLQGLTREQALNGGPVNFSLVREAGKIDLEGSFQNGKGSGTFRFTPNAAFVSAMKSRGFNFEANRGSDDKHRGEDRVFAAAVLNVTTALADDLAAANFGKLGVDDLFKAAIFKIDSNFVREMKASGFENLGMEELVKARIFKIDAEFVRQVASLGFAKEPFESLVKLQIFKVTPEFISEVRNEGLTNLQIEELVKLRIFKIDAQYIREAKADGTPLEVERLVQRKIGIARHR